MKKARKIIISVAPVGNLESSGDKPVLTARGIADDAAKCEEEGASLVHLHVKDKFGKATTDMELFNETLGLIDRKSDLIIQGSTGGDGKLSAAARCVVLENPLVQSASLNMGSTNFFDGVYVNRPEEIYYWAQRMKDRRIRPELEIFSPTMIEMANDLSGGDLLQPPFNFGLCMGIPRSIPADPDYLAFCVSRLPTGSIWGLIEFGRSDFHLVGAALAWGASWIRVGAEDAHIDRSGNPFPANPVLVREIRSFIELMGYEVADPGEARRMLTIYP